MDLVLLYLLVPMSKSIKARHALCPLEMSAPGCLHAGPTVSVFHPHLLLVREQISRARSLQDMPHNNYLLQFSRFCFPGIWMWVDTLFWNLGAQSNFISPSSSLHFYHLLCSSLEKHFADHTICYHLRIRGLTRNHSFCPFLLCVCFCYWKDR